MNDYGYTRNTLDVNFMITGEQLEDIRQIMRSAGFINMDIHNNVAILFVSDEGRRVDFLRIDASTMNKLQVNAMKAQRQEKLEEGVERPFSIPSRSETGAAGAR